MSISKLLDLLTKWMAEDEARRAGMSEEEIAAEDAMWADFSEELAHDRGHHDFKASPDCPRCKHLTGWTRSAATDRLDKQ